MKTLIFPLIIGLIIPIFSCAQKSNNNAKTHNLVSLIYEYGDGAELIVIGQRKSSVDSLMKIIRSNNKSNHLRYVYSFVYSANATRYLLKYMESHCVINESTWDDNHFVINFYPLREKKYSCFFPRSESKQYFRGMITWANASSYKNEFREFVLLIERYQHQGG